ncbi:MAG: HIT domain-containing protein [Candidatus Eisenbacteria bacterium]|nr:HIT domain-containing protein [Candidatus Eisenbacteria bacterium]
MKILTTPWRMDYIEHTGKGDGCIFCDLLASGAPDEEIYVLRRKPRSFLVLNIYPYTPGHLLAVPVRHTASMEDLEPEELVELFELCQTGEKLIRRTLGCRSMHTGANLGRAAGAGVPGHLHFHIVAWPEGELWKRWESAATLPEALAKTYHRLARQLAEAEAAGEG